MPMSSVGRPRSVNAHNGDAPSLGVVVTGGIGVLVVIAFVAAVVLGRAGTVDPDDRIGVLRREDGAVEVLAGRCPDERTKRVEVRTASDDVVLWRIDAERGTIDREFIVGAPPPPLFTESIPLAGELPAGMLEAEVVIDDVVAMRTFTVDDLDVTDSVLVACDSGGLGLLPFVFVVGALGVVFAYAAMVLRFLRRT
jgi:hypothetical protein